MEVILIKFIFFYSIILLALFTSCQKGSTTNTNKIDLSNLQDNSTPAEQDSKFLFNGITSIEQDSLINLNNDRAILFNNEFTSEAIVSVNDFMVFDKIKNHIITLGQTAEILITNYNDLKRVSIFSLSSLIDNELFNTISLGYFGKDILYNDRFILLFHVNNISIMGIIILDNSILTLRKITINSEYKDVLFRYPDPSKNSKGFDVSYNQGNTLNEIAWYYKDPDGLLIFKFSENKVNTILIFGDMFYRR